MSSQLIFEDGTVVNNVLKQYIRNNKNKRVGLLLACKDEYGNAVIGWSKCNNHDKFDDVLAHTIAYGRLLVISNTKIPPSLLSDLFMLKSRCESYFKGSPVIFGGILPMTEEEYWATHER